jgi:hypothetical protein
LDDVLILLSLWRVETKNVDLVLTFNVPLAAASGGVDEAGQEKVKRQFEATVKSLEIVDFGLFV